MGCKPYIPTDEDIETVYELKLTGASDQKCSEALSIGRTRFGELKKDQFEHAIKEARQVRRDNVLGMAEDALITLLSSEEYTETTEIEKDYGGVKSSESKTVTKQRTPSATITMFTLVNEDPDNWQSINKTAENHKEDELPKGATIVYVEDEDGGNFSYD